MEIYGKCPDARYAEHAAYPTPQWTALIACIRELAPAEASVCKDWMSKGDVDAESCLALAARLELAIAEGAVESYVKERNSFFVKHSSMPCLYCKGTGSNDMRYCHCCYGDGVLNTGDWWRDLYVGDVKEFIEFARHCGGFTIGHYDGCIRDEFRIGDFGLAQDKKGNLLGF